MTMKSSSPISSSAFPLMKAAALLHLICLFVASSSSSCCFSLFVNGFTTVTNTKLVFPLTVRDSSKRATMVGRSPSLSSQQSTSTRCRNNNNNNNNSWRLFSSDFGSAMPEKPQLTIEELVNQSADDFITNMDSAFSDDPSIAPPELEALRVALNDDAPMKEITIKMYELMLERSMRYDEDPNGTNALTPTTFTDIPNNLDVPEVKKEFAYLYSYGMNLMNRDMIDGDTLKEIVIERLIKRTGLSPDEFDKWLGY